MMTSGSTAVSDSSTTAPTASSTVLARGPTSSTTIAKSRSTPTSPSRTTFSETGGWGMRSSFPYIASSSSSFRTSGASSSGSDNSISSGQSSNSSTLQAQQQPRPAIPRTCSQPSLVSSRPPSSPHPHPHRPSPAHQRPAFKSRPSLPSLNTLAKMDFAPGAGFGVRKVILFYFILFYFLFLYQR